MTFTRGQLPSLVLGQETFTIIKHYFNVSCLSTITNVYEVCYGNTT